MRHRITFILKLAVPVAIIAWLVFDVRRRDPMTLDRLREQPKDWEFLALAFGLYSTAVSLTFVRWHLLVRALDIPFRLRDAFRLGFLGFMFNFVSLGAVGGDLFKAFLITHEHPRRRMEAVMSIMADRIVGMYALLVVTSAAILIVEIPSPSPPIQVVSRSTLLITVAVTAVLLFFLLSGARWARFADRLARIRRVGPLIQRTAASIRMYRDQPGVIVTGFMISIAVQALVALCLFLSGTALYATAPRISEHFVIAPVAAVVAALPIAPSGLGTYEAAMRYLYDYVPAGDTGVGKGLVVALCYRLMSVIVALIGVVFYWTGHREVKEVLHEVEEAQRERQEQASP